APARPWSCRGASAPPGNRRHAPAGERRRVRSPETRRRRSGSAGRVRPQACRGAPPLASAARPSSGSCNSGRRRPASPRARRRPYRAPRSPTAASHRRHYRLVDRRRSLRQRGDGAGDHHEQRERMRAHRLLVVATVLGCAGGQAVRRTAEPVPPRPSTVPTVSVDSLLAALTVRQQVGQLVIPWLSGSYTALDDSLFQVAARWVDSLEIGGLIVSVGSPLDIATKIGRASCRERV